MGTGAHRATRPPGESGTSWALPALTTTDKVRVRGTGTTGIVALEEPKVRHKAAGARGAKHGIPANHDTPNVTSIAPKEHVAQHVFLGGKRRFSTDQGEPAQQESAEIVTERKPAQKATFAAFQAAGKHPTPGWNRTSATGSGDRCSIEESSNQQGIVACDPCRMASGMYTQASNDPELAEVIARWEATPEAIKVGVLAILRAVVPGSITNHTECQESVLRTGFTAKAVSDIES